MKNALISYSKKAMEITNYYDRFQHQFECVDPELISEIQKSFLVPRITKTDLEPFREKFGHELPDDIKDHINLYWHPYIYGAYDCYKQKEDSDGYYKFDEGLVLFSVMKHKGKTDDDVLFQKYGVYDLTAELYDDLAERAEEAPISPDIVNEVKKYICIGWTEYAAHRVLYKIATGEIYLESWREDRVADDKPIAGSLSELINKIYFLNPGR